jgi:hypothetical protein
MSWQADQSEMIVLLSLIFSRLPRPDALASGALELSLPLTGQFRAVTLTVPAQTVPLAHVHAPISRLSV